MLQKEPVPRRIWPIARDKVVTPAAVCYYVVIVPFWWLPLRRQHAIFLSNYIQCFLSSRPYLCNLDLVFSVFYRNKSLIIYVYSCTYTFHYAVSLIFPFLDTESDLRMEPLPKLPHPPPQQGMTERATPEDQIESLAVYTLELWTFSFCRFTGGAGGLEIWDSVYFFRARSGWRGCIFACM